MLSIYCFTTSLYQLIAIKTLNDGQVVNLFVQLLLVDFAVCHKCDSRTDPDCSEYQTNDAITCSDYLDSCAAYIGGCLVIQVL